MIVVIFGLIIFAYVLIMCYICKKISDKRKYRNIVTSTTQTDLKELICSTHGV